MKQEKTNIQEKLKKAFEWLRPIEFFLLVIGIAYGVIAYYGEEDDRRDRRLIAGWQLISEQAPGSSGKDLALNYLFGKLDAEDTQALVAIDLSAKRHGGPVYLQNLELYNEDEEFGAYLPLSSFAGAILQGADLRSVQFHQACLYHTELGGANLVGTDFSYADLTRARLSNADMSDATLANANLSGAHMKTTRGLEQSQLDKAYYCETFEKPSLPDGLSVPSRADCDTSEGCKWSGVTPQP